MPHNAFPTELRRKQHQHRNSTSSRRTITGTNKMRKTNALYLKTQRLIAETHRDTEGNTETHTKTHTEALTETHTQTYTDTHTQSDTYKELLKRFTLPFTTHMNLNKLMLRKYSNLVPT